MVTAIAPIGYTVVTVVTMVAFRLVTGPDPSVDLTTGEALILAIGGTLGRDKEEMAGVLAMTVPLLPTDAPKHLLGIGEVDDLIRGVELGLQTRRLVGEGLILRDKLARGVQVTS